MTVYPSPGGWLVAATEQRSDVPALDGPLSISYGQLSVGTARLAGKLAASGVRRGQVVAVQLPLAQQVAAMLYSALYLGLTLLPLDPGLDRAQCERFLSAIDCDCLVGPQSSEVAGVAWIPAETLFTPVPGDEALPLAVARPLKGREIQLIIATSGTSGEPKGVMLSADNLVASVSASRQRLGLSADDCWLACLPLFHIGGLSILLRTLEAGARVRLLEKFVPEAVWKALEAGGVSHLSLVPPMLQRLLEHAADRRPPSTLRVVLVGGGPLAPELAQRARQQGWPLCVSYGMSETASQFATDCSAAAGSEPGQVGQPLPGYQVQVSGSGRIRVRGPAVMCGYANVRGEIGVGLDQGWFETGDLGQIDASGRLKVIGRADDLLVSGGKNIHPAEVEERLLNCPGVTGVGVIGREDPVWGVVLVALFTGTLTAEALEQWCCEHLPGTLRPRQFLQVKQLPQNALGKLYRPGLRRLLAAQG